MAIPLVFIFTGARLAPKPKNIIIVIMDGVGVSELSAAAAANGGNLQLGRAPVMGLMKIWQDDNLAPDACANATAIATGQQTADGILSLDSRGVRARTLAEYARDRKMLTALISVSSVTSPSAAAFFAHEDVGANDEKIAMDITRFKPDVLIGGGEKFFAKRMDKTNLVDSFSKKGYDIISKQKKAENFSSTKAFALVSDGPMAPVTKRGNFLSEVCVSAIGNMASYFEGYFMIIHTGQIEQAAKNNAPAYMCEEIKDVNKTLADMYQKAPNMDETLVIVLSTNETGGFVLNGGSLKNAGILGSWQSQKPTATMVPVFASGPGSDRFAGMYSNTDVFLKILSLMR